MLLEELHALERSSASDELVREFGLIVWLVVASVLLVDLLMSVLSVVYGITILAIALSRVLRSGGGAV